ncbi:SMP-30/gluconolactonase/LRE family protein [Nocardioides anomalus]|uniref:SMP-30/gluconolactonase/LRE family protein n=1 Tax=Nocardioides anomalus TaxID=2712223 RepID=A0A6G6WCM0_9ACTN|nr:SMP-30/gluconolactonase/LRE family protein [Nocardioides anomalus]QIG43078.1 SMP-30/gluconolactonase/LRE family protein [Nocardioides anomalus]
MADHELRTVVSGMSFTECPRWHEGRLWFVDFYTHVVCSVAEDGSDLRTEVEVPQQPSGLGWLPDGRLLYVSMRDRLVMRREPDGTSVVHADVSDHVTGHANDMVVDAEGRAWLGNFGFDLMGGADIETTGLLRIDPDGTVTAVADDLWFPNGSVVTPDGGTLIVDETLGNRISAFDIHPDGSLGERRDWATFGELSTSRALAEAIPQGKYAPDGCTLDADGCLWVADALGGRVCRVREGGEILETVSPGTGAFACMLGGSDGRTLFICCAPDFDEHARSAAREATIRAVTVDVPHAGLP